MWSQALSALLGIWLMVAPALLDSFSDTASANNRVVGPLVVAFGVIAMSEVMRSVRFGNTLAGAWLVFACFLFGYRDVALLTTLLAALGIVALSLISGDHQPGRFGGGWQALWDDDAWEKHQPDL